MNAKKNIRAAIRLQRAQRKLDKRIYPSCPKTREVAKLNEKREQLSKDIDATFGIMYTKGFRPGKDNQNPLFLDDFSQILQYQKEFEKISRKIDARCKQIGKTESDIAKEMYILNVGRRSTSF